MSHCIKIVMLFLIVSSSVWAQQEQVVNYNYSDFNLIVKVEEQEAYFNDMLKANPNAKLDSGELDDYLANLAVGWLAKGNIKKFRYYTKSDPRFSAINLVNLVYALEYLELDDAYLPIIKEVSEYMIGRIEQIPEMDVIEKGRFQVFLELNAMANAKLGNIDVAMKNMARSSTVDAEDRNSKYFKDSKSSYYDRYAIVLSAAGEHQKALDTLINAVRNGDSKPKLVNTLREIYRKAKGNDKNLDNLIDSLKKEAYSKYYKEVEKKYISDAKIPFQGKVLDPNGSGKQLTIFTADQHIHDISLPDPYGEKVNFSDHKGKTLVIDFWTTGCTPCVAAFAGFEHVVNEYTKDELQLFVINLFEAQETVQSFVAKKGITLDVLRDEPNDAYGIMATPTKIVFDGEGNIRFYAIAYAGSTDREYYKLKAMVEIVNERSRSK